MKYQDRTQPDPFHMNKATYIREMVAWLESKRDMWDLYAITVTFKPVDQYCDEMRWKNEFSRVLYRIARKLTTNEDLQKTIIPDIGQVHYERYEASKLKRHRAEPPHHIHALIPIPKAVSHRFWDESARQVKPAITRDVESMKTVINMDVQPIVKLGEDGARGWLGYCYKGCKAL
jgi:hypothetical protein